MILEMVGRPANRVILIAMVASLLSFQHAVGQITFQRTYSPTHNDYGQSVVQADNDGFYVAGAGGIVVGGVTHGEAALLSTDASGDTLYYAHYPAPTATSLFLEHIIKSSDGNLIVAGLIDYGVFDGHSDYNAYVAKITPAGNMLWSSSIGGAFKEWGYQVRETPEGGYVVAGWRNATGVVNHSAFYLVRLGATGDTLWTKTYPNPTPNWDQLAYCVGVMPDSGYVLAGTQRYLSPSFFHVIRTNSQGDTLWTKRLEELGSGEARDLEVLANGHIVVAGRSSPTGYMRPVLVELDENGELLWYRAYEQVPGGGLADWTYSLCKTTTGYALFGLDSNYDFSLINVDHEGDTLWTRRFAIGDGDYGYSVEQTSDGGFIMCGITHIGERQIALVKTDGFGNVTTSTHDLNIDPTIVATLFPNPVAGSSTFQYSTVSGGAFALVLHDGGGRVVRTIFTNERRAPGQYEEHIDLTGLASGAYTLVLSNGPRAVSVKAMKL